MKWNVESYFCVRYMPTTGFTMSSTRTNYRRSYSQKSQLNEDKMDMTKNVLISNINYQADEWTNVTPKILSLIGRNLHLQKDHPIHLLKDLIVNHFYAKYTRSRDRPIFAVSDNLSPVVSTCQNFDSMLIPKDHVSRQKSDNYYVNSTTMLRAHTSAHEVDLIRSGLDAFLTVGDVYRRDAIDSTHYPVFHQLEGVRLFTKHELFENADEKLSLFESGQEMPDKQECHTLEASKLVEFSLKKALEDCMADLLGKGIESRWVDAYFPFTHPSFELEIKYEGEWMEMLGCGVLRQQIVNNAGANDRIGWAFGLGLERIAMKLFNIPDIRYFWSNKEEFLVQFRNQKDIKNMKFKPFSSKQPALINDISFWIPDHFCPTDFYDLVRNVAGDLIENVSLVDEFSHPKSGEKSHCYRVCYRHLSRPLSQSEVGQINDKIKHEIVAQLGVRGRW